MHDRITYMKINFQQNRINRSVKSVNTNLFANNRKLHKFVPCNQNLKKSRLFVIPATYGTFRPI